MPWLLLRYKRDFAAKGALIIRGVVGARSWISHQTLISASPPYSSDCRVPRTLLGAVGFFKDCFDAGRNGTFAASMPAWSRTLFGSPVVGNAHGSCDRERRCAEQIRIAIVLIGNGIAQPMRSPLGN